MTVFCCFEIDHRKISTILISSDFKQSCIQNVYHSIHQFLCTTKEHVIKPISVLEWDRVHPKSFTSSEKCTVWIINRTDPSPPYKYTYITYIQWEVPTKNKGWRKIYSQAIEGKNTLCGCIKLLNAGKVYLYIVVFACSKETLTFFVHLTIMKLMGTYNYLLKWNGFLTKEDR